MNILISNDDGYLSQGIATLARIAGEFANVRVVAPERDRSGVSNSLTLDRPLKIRSAENGFYYVSGTPTDCIHLGLHALADFQPDLVLSGINHGSNLGDDTLYSGTVAAATEAYLMGIPAVAFSLTSHEFHKYAATAEQAVWNIVNQLVQNPPSAPILWNVNIPAVAPQDLRGHKIARLGRRHHTQSIVHSAVGTVADNEQDTDFATCESGYVSITPLQIDLTAYSQMQALDDYWQNLSFAS